ncbi:MAG TPA: type VI secretion system lipoprotein TssJ [Syntrophales bacterium]|nr:type VI secretion system lipoprotein TssJ [Syntrophales bacterium]
MTSPKNMNGRSISPAERGKVRYGDIPLAGKPGSSSVVTLFALFAIISFFLFTSCGTKTATDTAEMSLGKSVWSFAHGGIKIQYTADSMLNVFENEPHTLILSVYQTSNINTFNNLTQDVDGLKKLLQGQSFDPSVVGVKNFIVQPAEEKIIVLNRAEGARWVGIVAGYYALDPGKVSRSFNIPLITEKKGIYGFRKTESRAGQMTIKLFLGPSALHEREVVVK